MMAVEMATTELVRSAATRLRGQIEKVSELADHGQRQSTVNTALDECLALLSATAIWGEANRLLSSELWNIAGGLLNTGWLQARARDKPRGYAGDHELLRRICEGEVCDHPLGRHFDVYFQSQAAPQSVRNRAELAADWIVEAARQAGNETQVAIVGSGPAQEVVIACSRLSPELSRRLHVALLDMDGEALDGARARLAGLLPAERVVAVQGNLFRLARRPDLAARLQNANLILCTGLFDYLDATAAAPLLAEFWRSLAPGGAACVFNFAPHNPTRAYMEWIGNWYLTYRDEADLASLAAAAQIPRDCVTLGSEPLGIDRYLLARKPADAALTPPG
jgi:extracellular factor (EF) 3-hydroxypalmitic acid methyl ester biosynthesis protein